MNLLDAIYNISQNNQLRVRNITFGNNRANNMGEGLEIFIKDAFTNMHNEPDKNVRNIEYNNVFSFQGSKRNPPDFMLRNDVAIEVKKVESLTTELQLNSSHPKQTLKSNSPFITKSCKNCEQWTEKDFVYTIGHIPKNSKTLSSLWFIYGNIYAASENIYLDLKNDISKTINKIPNIEFSETKEIGRVNNVDLLRITSLRIRGMWLLKQPYNVFDYVHNYVNNKKFQLFAIIPTDKYDAFSQASKDRINGVASIEISDIKVNNPDNPVDLISCKLIKYVID